MALITVKDAQRKVALRELVVPFPEFGGDIRFVELIHADWAALDRQSPEFLPLLIIATAHGQDGRLFQDSDVNKVVLWPEHLIERAGVAALKVNGKAGYDEDFVKNSPIAPPNTASPPPSE